MTNDVHYCKCWGWCKEHTVQKSATAGISAAPVLVIMEWLQRSCLKNVRHNASSSVIHRASLNAGVMKQDRRSAIRCTWHYTGRRRKNRLRGFDTKRQQIDLVSNDRTTPFIDESSTNGWTEARVARYSNPATSAGQRMSIASGARQCYFHERQRKLER